MTNAFYKPNTPAILIKSPHCPSIFTNHHKSQKSSQDCGMTGMKKWNSSAVFMWMEAVLEGPPLKRTWTPGKQPLNIFDRQIPIFLDRLLANDASMTRQNHDQYCNSPPWSLLWTYSAPRWALSPEVTPSSGTPLPDLGVRADFIQVVYKMTFWPCLRRQRQNYGCQMHFINQTPLQFPSIPNIFKNDHKWSQIPEIFSRKGHDWCFVYFNLYM